ncbi:MAG TPA: PHP domain-containing protein [Acidobacteriota bacterium]|nr:PHP domain-containing protein [Acidobacteriota bacterium]HNT17588.1 PHP domain-containing protein [Acidobacteriota bacterium]
MIDLHTHSTASDGSLSPSELVDHALSKGITRLALTDHDTMDGLEEAMGRAAQRELGFIPGVEISAEFREKTMHILGFGIDPGNGFLNEKLKILRLSRSDRNPKIIERLNGNGFALTMEEVSAVSGGKVIGRPHMARVLFEKGYVSSVQEAFDLYLAKGKPCYVDKFRFEPSEAVSVIIRSGGMPVLAHPLSLGMGFDELESVVADLRGDGLEGMECFYRNHTEEDERALLAIAGKLGLVVTGGSDFHGANRPNIEIGTGEGRLNVPSWVWDKFSERLEEKRKAVN